MGTKPLIHKHWTDGGTCITNFDTDEPDEPKRPLFEAAIKAYGDPDLVISDTPMPPAARGCSLHDLKTPRLEGLSDFWDIFHDLQKQRSEVSAAS